MKHLLYSLSMLMLLMSVKSDSKYYNEQYRPQVHFSPQKNWLFESNGLVYYRGEYHLFYQNVSIDKKLLNNQMGHAVSKDLIHWQHLPFAFTPDEKATDTASCTPLAGSTVIDSLNVTKLQQRDVKPMLIFYSDSEGNQNLAYSNDKGNTWTKYPNNPIITNTGEDAHDPKVFYHTSTGKWILALYRGKGAGTKAAGISFYNSSDMLHWEYLSHLEGFGECPDIFEVALEGTTAEKKWVVLSGEGDYRVGVFDGISFKPETEMQKLDYGKNFFASQTLSNPHDKKVIQLAWMRGGEFPEMPFNGQMSFPTELSLRSTAKGTVLCRKPIAAISSLFDRGIIKKGKNLIPGLKGNLLGGIKGDAVYIKAILLPKNSDSFGITVRNGKQSNGTDIRYETGKKTLEVNGVKMVVEPLEGKIELEILVDRSSIEIYANKGERVLSTCFSPAKGEEDLLLYTQGGELYVESLEVQTLKSAWSNK